MTHIAVVDYGAGNLVSIDQALRVAGGLLAPQLPRADSDFHQRDRGCYPFPCPFFDAIDCNAGE